MNNKIETIYALAEEVGQTYGHGDYGREMMIRKTGWYGSGDFPPCFTSRQAAEEYTKKLSMSDRKVIVELQLKHEQQN